MTHVLVKLEVECQVNLPEGYERIGLACADPAIEAALTGLPENVILYLWGKENPPAQLVYEAYEDNCEIEEDDR